MACPSSSRVCRLCRELVPSKRALSWFSPTGIQQRLASRIEALLSVKVRSDDGLPGYICIKCKSRTVTLEKAAADLREFKQLASCSRSALERVRGPLKRTKCTSNDIGVSPDTARERPKCKLSRKRLEFNSKYYQRNWSLTARSMPYYHCNK